MTSVSLLLDRRTRRFVSTVTLVSFLPFAIGCTDWRRARVLEGPADAVTEVDEHFLETKVHLIEPAELVGKMVRFHLPEGTLRMTVQSVDYPHVTGRVWTSTKTTYERNSDQTGTVTVDLRDASLIEVKEFNGGKTVLLVVVLVGAVAGIIALANSGNDDPPPPPPSSTGGTGGSCPVVYVQTEDGAQPVGVLYAGATYRSLQRKDLLPLPAPSGAQQRLLLSNERHETQHTDVVELLLVEHAAGTRVVSTYEQLPLLVDASRPALHVTDLDGFDVTAQTTATDGHVWRSPLTQLVRSAEPPLREGVVATFAAPQGAAQPVVEIALANTEWLETVIERFMALTGDEFPGLVARGNFPLSGPTLHRWSEREGLTLDVEWKHGDAWEHVAMLPPVGPGTPRRVAVPLPPEAAQEPGPLSVRVSGGTGFWTIDEIGLSAVHPSTMQTTRLAPSWARDGQGTDERDSLARIDGSYQVLEQPGDVLYLGFDLPASPPDRARSAFLFSSGYYNLHPPAAATNTMQAFNTILAEPGGLAAFSLGLFRAYQDAALRLQAHVVDTSEAE